MVFSRCTAFTVGAIDVSRESLDDDDAMTTTMRFFAPLFAIFEVLVEPLRVYPPWVMGAIAIVFFLLGDANGSRRRRRIHRTTTTTRTTRTTRRMEEEKQISELEKKQKKLVEEMETAVKRRVEEALREIEEESKKKKETKEEKEDVEMTDSSPTASAARAARSASTRTSPVAPGTTPSKTASANGTEDMSWAQTKSDEGEEEITSPSNEYTRVVSKTKKQEEARRRKMEEEEAEKRRREETKREREEKKTREEKARVQNRMEELKRENERSEEQNLLRERWREEAMKHLRESGAYEHAEKNDLHAFLTLTMKEEIGIDRASIETWYKRAQRKFHPDKSQNMTEEEKVLNEEIFKTLVLLLKRWTENGKPLGRKQPPRRRPETPPEAKFSKQEQDDFKSTERTWNRAHAKSGTRRRSSPSEKKNNGGSSTSNNDSSRSNGFHFSSNPFSNAQPPRQQKQHQQQQQQQQQAGLKKPFSTGPKKSKTDSQPSSPSTRL